MIAKLATAGAAPWSTGSAPGGGSAPVAVVMASLRCLGEYMKCSAVLLKDHLVLLESMLVCESNERTRAECQLAWSQSYPCRMEALAVWLSVFRPGLSDTSVLVVQLVRTVDIRSEWGMCAHTDSEDCLLPRLDCFISALQCCLASLIIDGKVKDSSDIALSLVIPLLASSEFDESSHSSHAIQGCADVLMRTLCFDPRLVSRLLFRLCSTGEGSGGHGEDEGKHIASGRRGPPTISDALVSYFNSTTSMHERDASASTNRGRQSDDADDDTGALVAGRGDPGTTRHRRRVAAAMRLVLDLVKGCDILVCKLAEVERSAVQEVLRSGNVHVAELVDLLDASDEMAALVDQALQGGLGSTLVAKVTAILGRHALKAKKSASTTDRRPARAARPPKGQKTASTRAATADDLDEDDEDD